MGFVIIVGLGNIGGYTAQLIARIPGVRLILLIDKDCYEESNLVGQDISREDIGKPKVEVLKRRLRRLNPELEVTTFFGEIENRPIGQLRPGVLLGCVDSRGTRLYLGETAWSLGLVYIDAGVEPDGLLTRLNVYIPGRDEPCNQCSWEQADYDAVAQTYACSGARAPEAPTNGLAALGACAASLQAIEYSKILSGRPGRVLTGSELLIDTNWHRHYVTRQKRNPDCRFSHEVWRIETLGQGPRRLTLDKVFSLVIPALRGRSGLDFERELRSCELSLLVPRHRFVRMLSCRQCGHRQSVLRLVRRLQPADRKCRGCGAEVEALPGDLTERLVANGLWRGEFSRTLHSLGLEVGDVFSVARTADGSTTERYFQIGAERSRKQTLPSGRAVSSEPPNRGWKQVASPSTQAR